MPGIEPHCRDNEHFVLLLHQENFQWQCTLPHFTNRMCYHYLKPNWIHWCIYRKSSRNSIPRHLYSRMFRIHVWVFHSVYNKNCTLKSKVWIFTRVQCNIVSLAKINLVRFTSAMRIYYYYISPSQEKLKFLNLTKKLWTYWDVSFQISELQIAQKLQSFLLYLNLRSFIFPGVKLQITSNSAKLLALLESPKFYISKRCVWHVKLDTAVAEIP